MTHLLDGNVLVALVLADHTEHERVSRWFADIEGNVASCPITQGTLVRMLVRGGLPGPGAARTVALFSAHPRHDFWLDDISYGDLALTGVIGHRQVTDAYLASLARTKHARLATLDRGMAQLHTDVVDLLPD